MLGKRALWSSGLLLARARASIAAVPTASVFCRSYCQKTTSKTTQDHVELSKLLPLESHVTLDRDVISRLYLSRGEGKEAIQFLKKHAVEEKLHFAVVKIGGGLLEDSQIRALVSSLDFLLKVGLFPIVVHGGGPQLNEELDRSGEKPHYIEGLRVTSPKVLSIAARIFERENTKLVDALEHAGMRARPVSRVFEAVPLDPKVYGFVGDVSHIHVESLVSSVLGGYIPVLTSMGQTAEGQLLNINADVAALQLASVIQPHKIIFLNTTGGMLDGDKRVIHRIRLDEEFDYYMSLPWVIYGTKLKLKEFKKCLDKLPLSSTISLTSPENLSSELFEPRGLGTHISRGEHVVRYTSLDAVELDRARALIEESFERYLAPNYFQDIKPRLHSIYVAGSYEGIAILTNEKGANGVPYLDKIAVATTVRGQGVKEALWGHILKDNPAFFWRSHVTNKINPWYFQHSEGHVRGPEWTVFWYGLADHVDTNVFVKCALSVPSTLRGGATSAAKLNAITPPPQGYRIGLLGARGHTGNHLIHLLSQHSKAKLVCATSSTAPGRAVQEDCPSAPAGLKYIDVTAASIAKTTKDHEIDAWFLALHDNGAKAYVDALARSENPPTLIDLSSDHRFDPLWVYGQPEAGNREKLRGARRIANPGCYATGMYVTLAPLVRAKLLEGPAHFFGVSGYSGAGTKPTPKNDPTRLADNLMPYTLTNHTHEREVTHQLGYPVHFAPHVGQWFQGITLTGMMKFSRSVSVEELEEKYRNFYANEKLVKVTREIPEVKDAAKRHELVIGGLDVNAREKRVVTVTTLDNLLKGAATQAIQNLNLALNVGNELDGIHIHKI